MCWAHVAHPLFPYKSGIQHEERAKISVAHASPGVPARHGCRRRGGIRCFVAARRYRIAAAQRRSVSAGGCGTFSESAFTGGLFRHGDAVPEHGGGARQAVMRGCCEKKASSAKSRSSTRTPPGRNSSSPPGYVKAKKWRRIMVDIRTDLDGLTLPATEGMRKHWNITEPLGHVGLVCILYFRNGHLPEIQTAACAHWNAATARSCVPHPSWPGGMWRAGCCCWEPPRTRPRTNRPPRPSPLRRPSWQSGWKNDETARRPGPLCGGMGLRAALCQNC